MHANIPPHNITKRELAMQYSPGYTHHGALKRLSKWIARCPPLDEALRVTGYSATQKFLELYD